VPLEDRGLVPAAPDEMHDLEAVAVSEGSLCPLRPRNDIAVEFHGDPVGLHSELLDERGEVGSLVLLCFTVDDQVHEEKDTRGASG